MAWTAPSCDSLNFTIDGAYTLPACNMLNFDIGGTAPHEILSTSTDIFLDAQTAIFFQGDTIESAPSDIFINGQESLLDPLWPIESAPSDILIDTHQHDVEILPDMISNPADIFLDVSGSVVRGTEDHHLPTETSPGGRLFGWNKSKLSDDRLCMSFGEGEDIMPHFRFPVKDSAKPDWSIKAVWRTQWHKDNWIRTPWGVFDFRDHITDSRWVGRLEYLDNHKRTTWGSNLELVDEHYCVSYNEPGAHDTHKCVGYDVPEPYDWHHCAPWNEPGGHDAYKCVAWGHYSYYLLCNLGDKYAPPKPCGSIDFSFPSKYALIEGACEGIEFQLTNFATNPDPRCSWWEHVHTGIRDRYPGLEVPSVIFPAAKKVYYMLNSVLVKEILTNHPIEVLHVDATIDRDSWLWQFNITVASSDCLELIKPQNGVFTHIQIDMNGYTWYCTVEGWRENRSFGKDTWTVIGRSPSLMFANPVHAKETYTEATALQGQTLFDNVVSGCNIPNNWPSQFALWSTDWTAYDNTCTGFAPFSSWYVPGNTLSYNDKTPIEVMQDISGAIGAYIQTDPDDTVFSIKPLYAHMPWDWNSGNPNIDWRPIIEDQCIEIARSSKLNPYYQGIHVIGENIGGDNAGSGSDPSNTAVFVDVCRDGWCGGGTAAYAPMVTHPLVTSSKAGLENGRMVLAKTGEWVDHTLRLSVLCPGSQSSGLFVPGDMITVLERGYPWYGQVKSTTISATRDNSAFKVTQQIGVEEYIGN